MKGQFVGRSQHRGPVAARGGERGKSRSNSRKRSSSRSRNRRHSSYSRKRGSSSSRSAAAAGQLEKSKGSSNSSRSVRGGERKQQEEQVTLDPQSRPCSHLYKACARFQATGQKACSVVGASAATRHLRRQCTRSMLCCCGHDEHLMATATRN